jgi:hypothetical protein
MCLNREKGLDCDCLKLSEFFTASGVQTDLGLKINLISNGYAIGMKFAYQIRNNKRISTKLINNIVRDR